MAAHVADLVGLDVRLVALDADRDGPADAAHERMLGIDPAVDDADRRAGARRAAERPGAIDLRRPLPRPAQAASVGPGDGMCRKGVGVVGVQRHSHPAILLIL